MIRNSIRGAALLALLAGSVPMLAADTPLVNPEMRAGSYSVTVSDVDVGGYLPPGAAEGAERAVRRPRSVCYDPLRVRGGRARSLLEKFAGDACKAERAVVDGEHFNGKLACEDDSTFGSTSFEGTFDQTSADLDLTLDMSFKGQEYRMFMTMHGKFEWQSEHCDAPN